MNVTMIEDFTKKMTEKLISQTHQFIIRKQFKVFDDAKRKDMMLEASKELVRKFAKKHGLASGEGTHILETKYLHVVICPRLPWKFNLLIPDVSPAQWGEIVFPLLKAGAEFDSASFFDRLFIDPKNKKLVKEFLKLFPRKEEEPIQQPRTAEVTA